MNVLNIIQRDARGAEAYWIAHGVIAGNPHAMAQESVQAAETVREMIEALRLVQRMHKEAIPKFNWGASALDANAIDLLNRGMIEVDRLVNKIGGTP